MQRDLLAHHPAGIARAVELFVMRAGDLGDAAELLGPRDLGEEPVGVCYMGLDLLELSLREAAAGDREDRGLLEREDGQAATARFLEGPDPQPLSRRPGSM